MLGRLVPRFGRLTDHALDRGDRQPLEARDGEVAIEVMAVSRVGARPKPHAGIGELDADSRHALDELGERPPFHRDALLQLEGPVPLEAAALQPPVEEVVVVVPGDDGEVAVPQDIAELVEERAGRLDRRLQGQVAKLDGIAQQDDLVRVGERPPQGLAELAPPQQVDPAARAEMQVG